MNYVVLLLYANELYISSYIETVSAQNMGTFDDPKHDVSGVVYILDATRIKIEKFGYDGE